MGFAARGMDEYLRCSLHFSQIFTAFQSRNYRLYFGGQLISLVGTWMTQTATIWLVYQLTNSPVWLGAVAFASQAPIVLLSPMAGVWVDRLDRLTLMKATQAFSMVQALTLATLTLTGHISIGALTFLAVVQGTINAFDTPTRHALAVSLAEKREHLPAVIGMNSSMFNMARMVGPSIGGFVIAFFGAGLCYLFDGLSYIGVLAALFAMKMRSTRARQPNQLESAWAALANGFRYVHRFPAIRFLILFNGCMSLFAFSFSVLIPVYAKETFFGDARTLGYLMSSSAAGSMTGALYMASRRSMKGIGRIILTGGGLAGAGLLVFAWSRSLPISMACLLFTGLGGLLVAISNNTLVQNLVDEDKRGRVMSLFTAAFLGGMPLGSLLTGWIAEHFGISWATTINALACLVLGIVFLRNRRWLRITSSRVLKQQGVLGTESEWAAGR